jgi:hypothetical protein
MLFEMLRLRWNLINGGQNKKCRNFVFFFFIVEYDSYASEKRLRQPRSRANIVVIFIVIIIIIIIRYYLLNLLLHREENHDTHMLVTLNIQNSRKILSIIKITTTNNNIITGILTTNNKIRSTFTMFSNSEFVSSYTIEKGFKGFSIPFFEFGDFGSILGFF